MNYISISTSVGTKRDATRLCHSILNKKLGFCCHIEGPVCSMYTWKGNLETQEEWICYIKTTRSQKDALSTHILNNHPYETPELGLTHIECLNEHYSEWALDSLTETH